MEDTDNTTAHDDTDTVEPAPTVADRLTGVDAKARRDAAKYRTALRDAETERDALRARVEAYQHAEVETIAGERLRDPADLWRHGATLADMLSEDGTVDAGRVRATVDAVAGEHPHWAHPKPRTPKPAHQLRDGSTGAEDMHTTTWADVLGGDAR